MSLASGQLTNLTGEEQARIRSTGQKRGYVLVLEFYNRPRGGRVRPVRSKVLTTAFQARKDAPAHVRRYRDPVRTVTLYTIDALGRVHAEESLNVEE
jgi:hypothetical protein